LAPSNRGGKREKGKKVSKEKKPKTEDDAESEDFEHDSQFGLLPLPPRGASFESSPTATSK
jgi:hypothetical protein